MGDKWKSGKQGQQGETNDGHYERLSLYQEVTMAPHHTPPHPSGPEGMGRMLTRWADHVRPIQEILRRKRSQDIWVVAVPFIRVFVQLPLLYHCTVILVEDTGLAV